MINSISVKNYKAFESAKIDLKPITIFLGSNNIGKTSLMQLFLVLQNTRNTEQSSYNSALRLHGSFVSLGQNDNIFRNKDTSKDVQIGFHVDYKEMNQKIYDDIISPLDELTEKLHWELQRFLFFVQEENNIETNNLNGFDDAPTLLNDDKTKYISKIKALRDAWNYTSKNQSLKREFRRMTSLRNAKEFMQIDDEEFERVHVFSNSFRVLKETDIKVTFDIGYKNNSKEDDSRLIIKSVNILSGEKSFIKFDLYKRELSSDIIQDDFLPINYRSKLAGRVNEESSIFEFIELQYITRWPYLSKKRTLSLELVLRFINTLINEIKVTFNEEIINHVSPLRASPKRYYYVDRAQVHNVLDTSDADSISDVIKENRNNIVGKANKWLENFNINIGVETFKELIHTLRVTNKKENLSLDLTDVGFGISQVLPIILQGFLSKQNAITIMEQPEIHLHPKMQGDLADLFIEMITKEDIDFNEIRENYPERSNNKTLIIETHSEYLLYRLRRRISQKLISPDNIGLYFFKKSESNGTVVEKIEILEEGGFEWPEGFSTALKDTNEFIRNSRKIKKGNKNG